MDPVIEIPRIPEPADEAEVLREQLDYLIRHHHRDVPCCIECRRLKLVSRILLERFTEPARQPIPIRVRAA